MSIASMVNQKSNTIIRTVTGKLTVADIKQAFADSLSHPDFKTNMHVIWNLNQADVSNVSANQLIEVVEYIRSNSDVRGADYKIILVAPVDLSFGLSRMFEGYGNNLPESIHVLKNMDEAYRWIEDSMDSESLPPKTDIS